MEKLSRRMFFKVAGAGAAAHALTRAPGAAAVQSQGTRPAPEADTWLFFNQDEVRFIKAATVRLIPADENGPGALEAGVPVFIDRQLAGAWGAGERLYRSGPWQEGDETQGYQLSLTPSELFRHAMRAIHDDLGRVQGRHFADLPADAQDGYLKKLEDGKLELDGVPGKVFFESLLSMTMEGYFSDPVYGGNRDMVSWKMIGFPGAYATFYDAVDRHGELYTRPPISIGDDGRGAIHMHPAVQPAPRKGGK